MSPTKRFPESWDSKFVAYCTENGIRAEDFAGLDKVPRYIRFQSKWVRTLDKTDQELKKYLGEILKDSLLAGMNDQAKQRLRQGSAKLHPETDLAQLIDVTPVDWLPSELNVFSVSPRWLSVSGCSLYKGTHPSGGKIVVMDAASICSVLALGLTEDSGDACQTSKVSVLDLCCAPGMKLTLLSEILDGSKNVQVFGIDISLSRLFNTRSVLKKYDATNTTLLLADGVQFNAESSLEKVEKAKETHSEASSSRHLFKLGKRLRGANESVTSNLLSEPHIVFFTPSSSSIPTEQVNGSSPSEQSKLFDFVLVDTECTHDGSIAHIDHTAQSSGSAQASTAMRHLEENCHDEGGEDDGAKDGKGLFDLQLGLLQSGWANTKPGGRLVYSTCSFSLAQNELVVAFFLASICVESTESEGDFPESILLGNPLCCGREDWKEHLKPLLSHFEGDYLPLASKVLKEKSQSLTGQESDRVNRLTKVILPKVIEHSIRMTPVAAATSFQYLVTLTKPK